MSKLQTIGEIDLGAYGRVLVKAGRYRHGGQIAITLSDAETFEPVAMLSTNVAANGINIASDAFAVKIWSENAPLAEPMLTSGLFEDTGERIATGFVEAPVWRIKDPANIPPLEHFPAKWTPLRVAKMRQNKELAPRSDSIGTEKALERERGRER